MADRTTPQLLSPGMRGTTVPTEPVLSLSVDQYHRMITAGILAEADPIELLEGWLVPKMSKNPPHRASTRLIRAALERVVPPGWYVDSQEPITTADSEPEPDVSIIRGETRQYLERHPGPGEVALVVEVADQSLGRDRGLKKRLYARAGIPVYWLVNLPEARLEVYTSPGGPPEKPDYDKRCDHVASEEVPLVIEGREVARLSVRDLLP